MRLIDAEALKHKRVIATYGNLEQGLEEREVVYVEDIDNAPTIEAKPIVHAHWIEQEYGDLDTCYTCSNCKEDWVTLEGTPSDNLWKYCPACGAQMDEKESD